MNPRLRRTRQRTADDIEVRRRTPIDPRGICVRRGGRIVDPRGYVLIKMRDHHRADCRGYVYEHVLVAEEKLGRPLKPGEQVHHVDENKSNNDPSNLIVAANAAEHRKYHRKPGSRLRKPGEPNPVITCACGCGEAFPKYDDQGRPRRYTYGHAVRVVGRRRPFPRGQRIGVSAINARKTHCKRGHPFDERNTRRTACGRRRCRACIRAHAARYRSQRDNCRPKETNHA